MVHMGKSILQTPAFLNEIMPITWWLVLAQLACLSSQKIDPFFFYKHLIQLINIIPDFVKAVKDLSLQQKLLMENLPLN